MSAQKLGSILAVVLIVTLVAVFGIRQYGNARVAAQELSTVTEAVSEAVQGQKEAASTDARQAKENAVKRREIAAVVNSGKARHAEAQLKVDVRSGVYANELRMLNDSIEAANRIISE